MNISLNASAWWFYLGIGVIPIQHISYGLLTGSGSGIATASNKVLEITGGYSATFIMLLALTIVALILNLFIRKP